MLAIVSATPLQLWMPTHDKGGNNCADAAFNLSGPVETEAARREEVGSILWQSSL